MAGPLLASDTGWWKMPVGTTAQRPNTGDAGGLRFNSTTGRTEFGTGGAWRNFVRLDGDTITGAVTITANLTITLGSTITASGGTGTCTMSNGLVTTPKLLTGNGGTFSWAGSTSPTGFATERCSFNVTGKPATGVCAYNYTAINSDSVDGSTATNVPNAFRIDHTVVAGHKAGRIGILYNGGVGGATGDLPADSPQYVAVGSWFRSAVNNGGSAGVIANHSGVMFGGYDQVFLQTGGTFWRGIAGREIDIALETGASAFYKIGQQIVLLDNDSVHATGGVGFDVALVIANQYTQTVGKGWLTAIGIGSNLGHWPLDSTGSIMACYDGTGGTKLAANGIDLSAATFSVSAFKSTGFSIDGSGNAVVASLTLPLLTDAANDAAAAGAGVGVGKFYRNGSAVMQRVA